VISTSPGFTSKWLASRLYRFTSVYPEVDVRVSSSMSNANFTTDGVDVAIRNLPSNAAANSALVIEKLIEMSLVPVCSPRLVEMHGPLEQPEALKGVPLIHDDTLAAGETTNWADWFKAAGVSSVDVSRGLRFNSADHALDAASEGAGVLLARDVLAYDDLRMGRLVIPIEFAMRSGRAYYFICPKSREEHPHVQAFRSWIKQEVAALDWKQVKGAGGLRPRLPASRRAAGSPPACK
jgi:LysR family glycine cleavage system transcriptional activator